MSDELESLKKENLQLKNTLQSFSAQLRARVQMCDELYGANINLRASAILLDDQNQILNKQLEESKKSESS